MKKTRFPLIFFAVLLLLACQFFSSPASPTPIPAASPTQKPVPTDSPTARPSGPALPSFSIDWSQPFAPAMIDGSWITLAKREAGAYAGQDIPLPAGISQAVNARVLDGLTAEQKALLGQNGFVVIHSQEEQFGDIREETAGRSGQPYFLTTDAAYHSLHLLFDDLLKAVEREYFRPQMIAVTRATLAETLAFRSQARGTAIETETEQAAAYLSTALKLFDPAAEVDPSVAELVSRQVDQIVAAGGRDYSAIFPDFQDDFGAYKPVGHYAGDPDLESYFRGMTWFGHMHFRLADPETPGFVPSRLPLIVTLALRRAQIDSQPASDVWASMHKTLSFIVGPSDDAGPLEYADLMDRIYGDGPSAVDLADDTRWGEFLAQSDSLPAPQINSLFVRSTMDLAPEKGWRFMGQRFTLDGMIFQNLIFDKVAAKADGTRRDFPSGLDVMAAFGSAPALAELELQGATDFPNYSAQMQKMQAAVQDQPESEWLGRFYDGWLYSFFPVLQAKDASFPAYMRSPAWGYKDLNAALGSWAELKHDTILYTKMPEGAGGGGPPRSGPTPSYVEPNPDAFYRMAYIARELACGLENLVLMEPCNSAYVEADVGGYISAMSELGGRFETLGGIAAKELSGQPLTEDEAYAIIACLGMTECVNTPTDYSFPESEMPKAPVIAAVSGAQNSVLEVGVGRVDRIYVIVPLEGKSEIAQGGVFSYYEFLQPRDNRLTDDQWREMLANGEAGLPAWASNFVLPGGRPTETLFFRKGDVYFVTEAGDQLNMRAKPSLSGSIVKTLTTGDYVEIIDGPVQAEGYTWWQVTASFYGEGSEPTGW
jgi:hypothetical protein